MPKRRKSKRPKPAHRHEPYQMEEARLAWLNARADEMRAAPSYLEKQFAWKLAEAGIIFRQQVVIAPYIVDFLLEQKMLIIEVDGKAHKLQRPYDERRDRYLRALGYKLMRIPAKKVLTYKIEQLLDPSKRTKGQLRGERKEEAREAYFEKRDAERRYSSLDRLEDLAAIRSLRSRAG